jgi:threonine dehydrogenase-like Zn-dependent dehydrogenase
LIASPLVFGIPGLANPFANKLKHVCIGVGGMGRHDLQRFIAHPDIEIIAICDVDEERLQKAAELVPNARRYKDWRELFKKEKDNFDSVNVSVPDHNHFAIAISAIKMRKHVYCQKPMCHDVAEIRELTNAAKKAGIVSQLGTQSNGSKKGILGKSIRFTSAPTDREPRKRIDFLVPVHRQVKIPQKNWIGIYGLEQLH